MIKELTKDNFNSEVINRSGLTLVDFYADWCSHCKSIAPIIESIAKENPTMNFGKVNTENHPDLASQYKIMSIPALIIFKDGKEHKRLIGLKPKNEILKELK